MTSATYADEVEATAPEPPPGDRRPPSSGQLSVRPLQRRRSGEGRPSRRRRGQADAPAVGAPDSGSAAAAATGTTMTTTIVTAEQEAAIEAYRRFAREGSSVEVGDYYRDPIAPQENAAAPAVLLADSLIPTGKPRRGPEPTHRRAPLLLGAVVALAGAAGGGYVLTHRTPAPVVVAAPTPVVVDQTESAADSAELSVPAAGTAGRPYQVKVPAGWRAESDPTRPGGSHTDVTVTEPVLGLTVRVVSAPAADAPAITGKPVATGLRLFGRPATVVTVPGAGTVSRIATVTVAGVRYAVTMTVPATSQARDFVRAAVVARGLHS